MFSAESIHFLIINYPVGSKQKCILCFKELDADMQLACFGVLFSMLDSGLLVWVEVQRHSCVSRIFRGGKVQKVRAKSSFKDASDNIETYTMLHNVFARLPALRGDQRSLKFYRTQQYVTATLEGQNQQNVILYGMEYKYPGVYPFIECPLI